MSLVWLQFSLRGSATGAQARQLNHTRPPQNRILSLPSRRAPIQVGGLLQ